MRFKLIPRFLLVCRTVRLFDEYGYVVESRTCRAELTDCFFDLKTSQLRHLM